MPEQNSIAARYGQLEGLKGDLHRRCEDYAKWTVPHIFPLDSTNNSTEVTRDFQSIGARAVNHLANKIALVLFPAGRPFFRLDPVDELKAKMQEAGLGPTEIESALAKVEREAPKTLQKLSARSALVRVLKELVALGNTVLFYDETAKKLQVYNVRNYVVMRDLSGRVMELILRDVVAFSTLSDKIQAQYRAATPGSEPDTNVTLYTQVKFDGTRYLVEQALEDVALVEVGRGTYPVDELPWIVLTWELVRGKDYGSGLVEDFAGDFSSLSTLSESMTLGAAIAADVKFLVNPAGQTDPKDLNDAETGAYVYGRDEDIVAFGVDKTGDWQFVQAIINAIEKRLGLGFLLNSAVTRDAERVTAEEIRFQAQELEGSLGGVYSRLAEDLQLPIARIAIAAGKNKLPLEGIELFILTGMESLSRTTELEQVLGYINDLGALASLPEQALRRLQLSSVMNIMAMGRGLEKEKFVRPEEEVQKEIAAEQQALQQQALQQQAAQTAGKIAEQESAASQVQ
jgi:hypothetical protein